jgi:hypothetical protein
MDEKTKKPRDSDINDPVLYFIDFLKNRDPYCLQNRFYSLAKTGSVNERNEEVDTSIIDQDGYMHKSHIFYYQYVDIILTKERKNSIEKIEEMLIVRNFAGRKDLLINILDRLSDMVKIEEIGLIKRTKADYLNDSIKVKEVFMTNVNLLITFVNQKLDFYIKHESKIKKKSVERERNPKIEIEDDSFLGLVLGRYQKEINEDIEMLKKNNFFVNNDGNYEFIGSVSDLIAITERWKINKWLLPKYIGYQKQSEISTILFKSFNIEPHYSEKYVNGAFKKSSILEDGKLSDKIKIRMIEIDEELSK